VTGLNRDRRDDRERTGVGGATTVERPRIMQQRVPSLPTMSWQDDGL